MIIAMGKKCGGCHFPLLGGSSVIIIKDVCTYVALALALALHKQLLNLYTITHAPVSCLSVRLVDGFHDWVGGLDNHGRQLGSQGCYSGHSQDGIRELVTGKIDNNLVISSSVCALLMPELLITVKHTKEEQWILGDRDVPYNNMGYWDCSGCPIRQDTGPAITGILGV